MILMSMSALESYVLILMNTMNHGYKYPWILSPYSSTLGRGLGPQAPRKFCAQRRHFNPKSQHTDMGAEQWGGAAPDCAVTELLSYPLAVSELRHT